MVEVREYNLATGHIETLARVLDQDGPATRDRLDDHSTDHVVYVFEGATPHAGGWEE